MNAAECADAVTEYLVSRLLPAAEVYANTVRNDIREAINIPDGGTKANPIHSKRGEPPRRETGDYRNSWVVRSERQGDTIVATIGSTSFLGPILEFKMNRPHVAPAYEEARASAASETQANL